jgi:hypothetical protein
VKRIEVLYIRTYEDSIIKPTTHCLKEVRGDKGVWDYNGLGELV